MKTAIIVHGMPSKEEYYDPSKRSASRHHFIPWLQRQLILKDILTQTPEMPEPYDPDYQKWSSVFEQFKINKDTLLVGHSCGAGFLVRYLSEHKLEAGKVILVAPWLDPTSELKSKMFSFQIDENLKEKCEDVVMMYSTDDDAEVLSSVDLLSKKIKDIDVKEFIGKGHFTYTEMGNGEFPELLEIALS